MAIFWTVLLFAVLAAIIYFAFHLVARILLHEVMKHGTVKLKTKVHMYGMCIIVIGGCICIVVGYFQHASRICS